MDWVPVGEGHMALGHRPKLKEIPGFPQQGVTHVVTLLSEREGAERIGQIVQQHGLSWVWFPMASAAPPEDREDELRELFSSLKSQLDLQAKIFLHCSAGIHRTGMITYAFLRSIGVPMPNAQEKLSALRSITAQEVGADRITWGDAYAC